MVIYDVQITSKKSKKKKFKIESRTLLHCESTVIMDHMEKLENGATALISKGKESMTFITKDKTKKHWNHDGYKFSL